MTRSKILVVDDEQDVAELLCSHLNLWGYSAKSAHDAQACFTSIEKEKPDLLLLDIRLPGLDGLTVCLRLRDQGIPVIIMTSSRLSKMQHAAEVVGASDYIEKPFSVEELEKKVKRIMEKTHA